MNTYQLECFLSLTSTLNFAKTAEQMHTSQPAITRQIQSLEKELHTQLFYRTKRNVELSEDGKSFIGDARNMIAISNRAINKFHNRTGKIEPLSIASATTGPGRVEFLTPVLTELKEEYPNLHPALLTIPITQAIKKIEEGTIQIAIGPKIENSQNCVYKEFAKSKLVCLYNEKFDVTSKEEVTTESLKEYPCILFNPLSVPFSLFSKKKSEAIKYSEQERYYCDYPQEAIILAESGMGITVLPEILIPEFVDLPRREVSNQRKISYGIYYRANTNSQIVKAFIKKAKEQFQK